MSYPEKKSLAARFNHPPEVLKRLAEELLQEAAQKDASAEKIRALIERGAPLDEKTPEGCTALILAAFHGHKEIAFTLIEHGAKLDEASRDHYDFIPHMHGRLTDMIDFGSSIHELEKKSLSGATALMTAVAKGHVEIARALVVSGAKKDGALAYARPEQKPDFLRLFGEKPAEKPSAAPHLRDGRQPKP
jgi:hypothetical protein